MIKMIIMIKRREGMSHDEFVRYQREVHMPLLLSIPEARRYIRRFVVSYPTPAPDYSGPDYDSVVEAWFESMENMNALYFCDNFLSKVNPNHKDFMDLSCPHMGASSLKRKSSLIGRPAFGLAYIRHGSGDSFPGRLRIG